MHSMKGTVLALLYIKQKILNHFFKKCWKPQNHIPEKSHPRKITSPKRVNSVYESMNDILIKLFFRDSPHLTSVLQSTSWELTGSHGSAPRPNWTTDHAPTCHMVPIPTGGDLVILVPTQEGLPSTRKNSMYCDSGVWYSLSGPRIKIFPLLLLENNCLWASCGGAYLNFRKKDAEAGGLQRPTWDTGQVPGYL